MSLYTYNPTANQSPDATLGGLAVTSPTNTGHASSTASCSDAGGSQSKSCRWFTFPAFTGLKKSVTLKFDHTTDGALSGPGASNSYQVDYSVNGGSNWTNAVLRQNYAGAQGPTTASVTLSATQDLTAVQVRDFFAVSTTDAGESASATATIANVKLEVVTAEVGVLVMT